MEAALKALCLAAAFSLTAAARADPLNDGRALSADPDLADFGLAWRAHMHGVAGAEIPLVGDAGAPGLFLRIPAAVELHNVIDNVAPNNYWRGLLGVALGYRLGAEDGLPGSAWALELQHESDHETVDLVRYFHGDTSAPDAPVGFLQLNSVGLAGWAPWLVAGGQQIVTGMRARLHVLSCNVAVERCASGQDGWGSRAFEARLDGIWMGTRAGEADGKWRPFLSAHFDWLVPNGLVARELRAVGYVGCWKRTSRGLLQLFVTAWLGNDAGYERQKSVEQLGLGVRWTP